MNTRYPWWRAVLTAVVVARVALWVGDALSDIITRWGV